MAAVLQRAAAKNFPGVRLVQAAYHNRSLSLYTKLGFERASHCLAFKDRHSSARLPIRSEAGR